MLKEVFVLTDQQRVNRDLVRTRRQLVQHRSDVMRQVKAKLLFHTIRLPGLVSEAWSGSYIQAIRKVEYPFPALRIAIESLLVLYEHLTSQVKALTRDIMELSKTEPYKKSVNLLQSAPGIGRLTAMEILTELVDLSRFPGNDQLASFLGLTPSEFSSGENVRQGRITHCGNTRIRSALVESSWILIRRDPVMRKKFERIKRCRGGKRAIVAIARKFSGRIRHLLLHEEPYVLGIG
jgi:transposase